MNGVFVTGTDTDVGKTVCAAWLARRWEAKYWKPVQSGAVEGSDAESVARLADLPAHRILPSIYRLGPPLSPHEAARLDGIEIRMSDLVPPVDERDFVVVEGAGGVLVPLNGEALMVDLMAQLALPVIVVARSGLGTINHTLLTLEALRHRDIKVAGVVMNGPPNPANRRAIETYGKVEVLAELPRLTILTPAGLDSLPPPPPLESL